LSKNVTTCKRFKLCFKKTSQNNLNKNGNTTVVVLSDKDPKYPLKKYFDEPNLDPDGAVGIENFLPQNKALVIEGVYYGYTRMPLLL